jgi:hypothetical protein
LVSLSIQGKFRHAKLPIFPFLFLPHRRVGFDLLDFDDPVEHGGI